MHEIVETTHGRVRGAFERGVLVFRGIRYAARIPLLVGTNLDEWRFYGLTDPKVRALDRAGLLRRFGRGLPGADAAGRPWALRVVETYHDARTGRASVEAPELWFAIQTDRWFRYPAMRLAELHAEHVPATFAYLFDWASPALGGALGSCHTLEIPFVFGADPHARLLPFVGAEQAPLEAERAFWELLEQDWELLQ